MRRSASSENVKHIPGKARRPHGIRLSALQQIGISRSRSPVSEGILAPGDPRGLKPAARYTKTENALSALRLRPAARVALLSCCLLPSLLPAVHAETPPWVAQGAKAMVATDSKYASQVGLEILQSGGNAVDATVAVSFALAVTRPYSTGPGGGGFMILRLADGRIVVQDFRETAPAAATENMYLTGRSRSSKRPSPSLIGHLAVGVPGVLAGRCQALAQFGTMTLERVTAPAIKLAKDGFPVDADYVKNTADALAEYERHPELKESCGYVYRTHLREGKPRSVGETLRQPALARLLEAIAKDGADAFYRGPIAKAIADEMRKHGGIITEKDLAEYKVRSSDPVISTYRDYEIIGMPPPSSGGVAVAQTLNILEALDYPAVLESDPGLAAHYRIEAMKHAFADRARRLGDTGFAGVTVALLTSKVYAGGLASTISPLGPRAPKHYGSNYVGDDSGTSHFNIVDQWGNVVVSTETINTEFGSLAAVDQWGLILNNQMDDFAAEPGKPNAFGLIQSRHNAIAPGKRPLSSMSPTIVLKNGAPFLMLGGSGGPRIISSVLDVLLDVLDGGLKLEEAMQSLRLHHQWQPDEIYFDTDPPAWLRKSLERRGHKISEKRRTGIVQVILRTKDGWLGVSDPRKGGEPRGY